MPRVFLVGGDRVGWALDEELRLRRLAHDGIATLTDLAESDVVMSVVWQAVLSIPARRLAGKRVLTYVAEDIRPCLATPTSIAARAVVGCWLSASRQESARMEQLGLRQFYMPFIVDTGLFRPLGDARAELRRRHGLPEDAYLIGSFQRDTEGRDLRSPKVLKAPDVFAETLRLLHARGLPVHAVLAGPRRFWLRRRLEEIGVPFTYVGRDEQGDDVRVNALPRSTLNELYNAIDVYCVGSRLEGVGPQAIVEATAAGCAVVSTHVGLAADALEPVSLVGSAVEAAETIERDIHGRILAAAVSAQRERVVDRFGPTAIAERLRGLYQVIDEVPVCTPAPSRSVPTQRPATRWQRAWQRLIGRRRPSELTLSLWHEFHRPPYGGGNQFFIALRNALRARGVKVVENSARADVHLVQSVWFDVRRFRRIVRPGRAPVVHRIGAVVELGRGEGRDIDDQILRLNHDYASVSAVVSEWCYANLLARGHQPKNAVLVPSAVDPAIFNAAGRAPFDRRRKLRLIATSWSNNARKGGPVYRWLEQHLDWDRYDFTFVGRVSEPLERARMLPPVGSESLADLLREHDVFVAASRHEACSNAVLEALACGLPVLYLNDGGHPEIVSQGGLPFEGIDDVLPQLDKLVADYETYQTLIAITSLDDVADTYLELLREIA